MKIKLIAASVSMLFLTSCAALDKMNQSIIKEKCNEPAAYNAGLADGLTPKTLPDKDYASGYICPDTIAATINTAYLRGFAEGVKSRPQEITINKNITEERK